jgi:predicted dehydrogenase
VTHHRGTPSRYGVTTTYAPEGEGHGSVVWEPQNTYATLENKALFTQGMYQEMRHFCDCVLEGTSPTQGTLEFALDIMKVYEAALLSDGHPVATADIPVR